MIVLTVLLALLVIGAALGGIDSRDGADGRTPPRPTTWW